ncbi:ABC transporter [Candidatus Kaiserbacteria bacterium RIFCSPLOWO2_01_FULL_54_13]|uniref:ABC transporter n=1 Tax=Candidatus Kaiserbacteria bacterium RIFCSPLOWO2_01_FULL_54_13 TaxID=1798512 RepID=A0A1F6F283_9BACT|nr:MAG: ABC transporter [Candidatus Kaiserbacteria bacterium RIFCSPLOWO2_01_FULL_54_13]
MIQTTKLVKTFKNGDVFTPVLRGIDFQAREGEWVAIMGRSGAGKSTLLYQMSLLDDPTEGKVIIDGHDTHTMSASEKMRFRLMKFGFVFQDYALLPELSALENIALPLPMQGLTKGEAYGESIAAMERANLGHRLGNLPSQLSGGEQQRVSIVRAVAHKPKILFADEPTANLDNESAKRIMEIFTELHRGGQTIIMVTHEDQYAKLTQRIVQLDDGKIISEQRS